MPLGYKIRLGLTPHRWTKIIGVCADARYRSITQEGSDIFVSYLQAAQPTNYVVIRGKQSAGDLASLVRRTLSSINAARHRFDMVLLLCFGLCSVILGAGGIYSVVAELVTNREHEMTIKTALGAGRLRVTRDIVSGTLAFVLIGEAFGGLGAAAVAKSAAALFYGISPQDPVIVGSAAAFFFVVAITAAIWPAWNATCDDARRILRK